MSSWERVLWGFTILLAVVVSAVTVRQRDRARERYRELHVETEKLIAVDTLLTKNRALVSCPIDPEASGGSLLCCVLPGTEP